MLDDNKMTKCLSSLNDLSNNVEKIRSEFSELMLPEYFEKEFSTILAKTDAMFKNLTKRNAGENPEISANKILACADSLRGIDEQTRKSLLILAATQIDDMKLLTPEVIKANIDTFKVIFDESNVEANQDEIVFNANAQFQITIDDVIHTCTLKGTYPVPYEDLVLSII